MRWSDIGTRVPEILEGACPAGCRFCSDACPFGAGSAAEDEIGQELFGAIPGVQHRTETGYYVGAYVGYAMLDNYRAHGSSGGLGRWFLASLLERSLVDYVASVRALPDRDNLFALALMDDPSEVLESARSVYYPVDMAEVLGAMLSRPGRYAAIGLPCFVKALRLASQHLPSLRERLVCVAGLACGQLKSRSYAEYLVRRAGTTLNAVQWFSFREKAPGRPANQFEMRLRTSDGCYAVPNAWVPYQCPQFALRSCDFCDDYLAETADVTFMGAWLRPYSEDHEGYSIAVVRSSGADQVFDAGMEAGEVCLSAIPAESVVQSEERLIRVQREMLARRLWLLDRVGRCHPDKRVSPVRPSWLEERLLTAHERVRTASHTAMARQRAASSSGLEEYNRLMAGPLGDLRRLNRLSLTLRQPGAALRNALKAAARVLSVPGCRGNGA